MAYNTNANALKYYNGSAWVAIVSGGITSVAQDGSPQLGGNLDVVTHSIVSTSNRNIAITPNGSGKVVIDGLSHPVADGSAGQALITNGGGVLSFATVSSAEVYGFNTNSNGQLIITTTNQGADNITESTFASFDDVIFAASGMSFSISNTQLICTI